MKKITRRNFLKTITVGGIVFGLKNAIFLKPLEALADGDKHDIGQCKSVTITCISELGWLNTKTLVKQIKSSPHGKQTNHWDIPWKTDNAAGSSSLIDIEALDGRHHKILLDAGWGKEYMKKCFKRNGIDKMLKKREIDYLFITHEHMDHFWGLQTILELDERVNIIVPNTFYSEGCEYLKGKNDVPRNKAFRNAIVPKGKLIQLKPNRVTKLYDGCAAANFDLPIMLRARGEQCLYFNIKDRGIVIATGCCHQGVLTSIEFARKKIAGAKNMHGLYGGLHISPFGPVSPERVKLIKEIKQYNFDKVAVNHCTGLKAIEMMVKSDIPVVRGTARFGSKSKLCLGNSDTVVFA
jgi:7,8-dihydropterin-6-yl-methyl-4-(beta-D-ribofuranosyl)aminobenzene 5'-phosphate synthase